MATYWTLENTPGGPRILLKQEGWQVSRWRAGHMQWVDCPVHLAVVLRIERDGKLRKVTEEEMSLMATADAFDVSDHTWDYLLSRGAPSIRDIDWHFEAYGWGSG